MITESIGIIIEALALKTIPNLLALKQAQALIMRGERKLDRIDIKLLKEAKKISRKELASEIKQEGARPSKRKGSITYKSYTIEFKKRLIASIR